MIQKYENQAAAKADGPAKNAAKVRHRSRRDSKCDVITTASEAAMIANRVCSHGNTPSKAPAAATCQVVASCRMLSLTSTHNAHDTIVAPIGSGKMAKL